MSCGEKKEAGWEELFIAIWETAVRNDYEEAVKRLTGYAYRKAYDEYNLIEVKPLKQNSKEIQTVKKAIRKQAKVLCERLLPRIRELVYAESQEWPNNRYKTTKDPEYKEIFNELKKEAVAFATEEIMKAGETGEIKYKPREFAELVGVSVKTLQRWDKNGTLPAQRTPTNRRYYTQEQLKVMRRYDYR